MLKENGYSRPDALRYAHEWAFKRNPRYLNFDDLGGDCTNFASQCIYAGCGVVNPTPVSGWYYRSADDRAPAWTGVPYLYKFLVGNEGEGPYGVETDAENAEAGDLVQLGDESMRFYHCPVIVQAKPGILVAAHTYDAYMRPLSSYAFAHVRFVHILGSRISV